MMEDVLFDLESLGNKNTRAHRKLTGITLAVYDGQISISDEAYALLGSPETVEMMFSKSFDAFFLKSGGAYPVTCSNGRRRFGSAHLRKDIGKLAQYDYRTHYVRLNNGQQLGEYVMFPLKSIELIEKGVRNGNN